MVGFLQFLAERGATVLEVASDDEERNFYMQFDQTCRHLAEDGRCGIYNEPYRPSICAEFPAHPSDLVGLPEGYCGYSFEWAEEDSQDG